jgi:hypothetical protein
MKQTHDRSTGSAESFSSVGLVVSCRVSSSGFQSGLLGLDI